MSVSPADKILDLLRQIVELSNSENMNISSISITSTHPLSVLPLTSRVWYFDVKYSSRDAVIVTVGNVKVYLERSND